MARKKDDEPVVEPVVEPELGELDELAARRTPYGAHARHNVDEHGHHATSPVDPAGDHARLFPWCTWRPR